MSGKLDPTHSSKQTPSYFHTYQESSVLAMRYWSHASYIQADVTVAVVHTALEAMLREGADMQQYP